MVCYCLWQLGYEEQSYILVGRGVVGDKLTLGQKKKRFVSETRAHCYVKSILARSAMRRAFFVFFVFFVFPLSLAIWSPVFSLRSNDPDNIANRQNYYRNI